MNLLSKFSRFAAAFIAGMFSLASPAIAQEDSVAAEQLALRKEQRTDIVFYDAVKARLQGDDIKSEQLMLDFVKERPEQPAAYYDLSRYYFKEKKYDKAIEYVKKAIDLDKENKWYREHYANSLAMNNRFEEAAEILQALAHTEKYNAEYLQKASLLYMRSGKNQEALKLLDELIVKEGIEEQYLMQKQQIYLKMDDLDNAAKTIEQLIEANPYEGRYYALLAEMYENNNQKEKARDVYTRAQKVLPDDPSVQLALAAHFMNNKDTARSDEYVKKAILNKDLDANTQLGILNEYIKMAFTDTSKRKEIMEIGRQLAEQHQKNAEVLYAYGSTLVLNGERDKALVQYKRSLEIDQSNLVVWIRIMDLYLGKEDADSLKYYSDKALKLFPNQAIVHYYNGMAQSNKGDYISAAKTLNRAIDMQPEEDVETISRMYGSLGDIYNSSKQFELSDSAFRKAIALEPNNSFILNNYSYYLSLRNADLQAAEKMSRHTLELVPNEPTFMDTYGWILYKMGKYDKALEYIQNAIDKTHGEPDGTLYDHLGDVHYKLGNKEKAVEAWKKAKQKGVEDIFIDKKIQEQQLYE